MNVQRSTLQSVLDNIVLSLGYKTTVGPTDKNKVTKAMLGQPSPRPSARLAQAAFDVARMLNPLGPPPPPPPPPPPTYKKVAPRVAFAQGGSDARYCCIDQPGVFWNNERGCYQDEVAQYDRDGLCLGTERSGAPAVTSTLEIDGRPYCSLPLMGDPEKNTGSWAI